MIRLLVAILLSAGFALTLQAQEQLSAEQRARYQDLIAELRCLVCQNQNIAESNAPLAEDLRNQVRTMIAQGKTDAEIRDWMIQRYGDFVLYRPPLKPVTWLLWFGPFLLLLIAFYIAWRLLRARRGRGAEQPADTERLRRILESDERR